MVIRKMTDDHLQLLDDYAMDIKYPANEVPQVSPANSESVTPVAETPAPLLVDDEVDTADTEVQITPEIPVPATHHYLSNLRQRLHLRERQRNL